MRLTVGALGRSRSRLSRILGTSQAAGTGRYELAEIDAYRNALLAIANLDPSFKGVFRKYQMAIQTARIALGLEVK